MSIKSQEKNMRRLADLLGRDLSYIWGERESGPNGDKKVFLNTGRTFLRALAKDLGLRDVTVSTNPGGMAVSGDCSLIGMWEENGIYIEISQILGRPELSVLYRAVRHSKDYSGGINRWLSQNDLAEMSYPQLVDTFSALRTGGAAHERAA